MKPRLFLPPLAFFALLSYSMISMCWGDVLTFDDLSETASGSFIANGYGGLVWSNFAAKNAILYTTLHGVSGYYYGMVSASNVAYGAFSGGAEIDSPGTNFNFQSAYFTGAWNSNLNIQVQGFSGATMLFNTTVVASATSPTLFALNYLNIDRLTFNPSGGEDAGFFQAGGVNFAMDNFTFEFVPEPSAFLLAAFGALTLWPFLKRKRA